MEVVISDKQKIGIIDYGAGNITSVSNALNYLKIDNNLVRSPDEMRYYSKVILPGVGSFKNTMDLLRNKGLDAAIKEFVSSSSNKFLGICLGMQLLYDFSQEDGGCEGLGLIEGSVERLVESDGFKVPNIGWRKVNLESTSGLYESASSDPTYYFVHSFACHTKNAGLITATLDYNGRFSCSIESDNIFAVQFHPEKSQKEGLKVLAGFEAL